MDIKWNEECLKKYEAITNDLPQFHRTIAKRLVKEKAVELAEQRGSDSVELDDLVLAFFEEVPPAFKDMMKKLLNRHGLDYSKYLKE
ncbi:MAG: hypothetical protein KBB01_00755 [Candidatus Omnitrophica bacterium]|jgi:hypothetical protein|nr:hypothetical protein [Candidatus Omnitrophota bacterium]